MFSSQNKKLIISVLTLVAVAITVPIFLFRLQHDTSDTKPPAILGLTDKAILEYEQKHVADPQSFKTTITLAQAYLQKIRETADSSLYGKVTSLVDEAEKIDPKSAEIPATRALVMLSRHHFKEALELGKQAQKISPDTTNFYGIVGDAQIELGQYPEAVATLQTMVDRRPDFASFTRIAYARELYGDVEGAIESMQLALTAGATIPENVAWAHTELARLYANSGQVDKAHAELTAALTALPTFAAAERALGYNALARGELTEAGQHFDRAVALLPIDTNVADQADFYALQGNTAKAAQLLQVVRIIYGVAEKNGVNVNLELALFLAEHDTDLAEAKTRALAGYAARPSVHAADVVAWTLYKNKDYTEAKKYSVEALRLGAKDPATLFHTAKIAEAGQDTKTGEKYLAEVKKLNPYFSMVHSAELMTDKK